MDTTSATQTENITVQGQSPDTAKSHLWVGDHFSFHDLLDAVNPLQHIPIVSTIYRSVTGDTLGNAARVVGDGLYGGVLGVIGGLLDVSVIEATGKDIGQNLMGMLDGDDGTTDSAAAPAADAKPADAGQAAASPAAAAPAAPPSPATAAAAAASAQQAAATAAAASAAPAQHNSSPGGSWGAAGLPLANTPKLKSFDYGQPSKGIAIDTSPEGLAALHAKAANVPRPVPLDLPPGTMVPTQNIPHTAEEFAQRMQEGLDKYKALVASREAAGTGTTLDQVQ